MAYHIIVQPAQYEEVGQLLELAEKALPQKKYQSSMKLLKKELEGFGELKKGNFRQMVMRKPEYDLLIALADATDLRLSGGKLG